MGLGLSLRLRMQNVNGGMLGIIGDSPAGVTRPYGTPGTPYTLGVDGQGDVVGYAMDDEVDFQADAVHVRGNVDDACVRVGNAC